MLEGFGYLFVLLECKVVLASESSTTKVGIVNYKESICAKVMKALCYNWVL